MFRWGWGRPKEKKLWRPASRGCNQYNSSIWYNGCLYWKRLLYSALNRRVGLLLTQFRTKLSMLIFWHIKYMVYQIAKEGIHVISCTIWILLKHKILKVEEYNFWSCYLKIYWHPIQFPIFSIYRWYVSTFLTSNERWKCFHGHSYENERGSSSEHSMLLSIFPMVWDVTFCISETWKLSQ